MMLDTSAKFTVKMETAYNSFLKDFPGHNHSHILDELRLQDFARLEKQQHIYLDYTGGAPYPDSLVRSHAILLQQLVLGNPHSKNNASLTSTRLAALARHDVLHYFNADAEEYLVIFTHNASGALKLVGESYPFNPESHFLLTADNHNSVNGIREFARRSESLITYIPLNNNDLRIDDITPHMKRNNANSANLFAYPAQSNFSGVQHPLNWIEQAHDSGYDVILDAAAFVPTNRLDLGRHHADFVSISFYKMFGYPTGIGALIARKSALTKLRRPWFAGGTVKLVSTHANLHVVADQEAAFEEGSINYLNFPAISTGLAYLETIGIELIHHRVSVLTSYLLDELQKMHHSNNRPMVHIYGPTENTDRGGIIAFNIIDPEGKYFQCSTIETEANHANISIRTGCFCNPGAGEYSLSHDEETVSHCFSEASSGDFDLIRYRQCLGDKADGAVRVSMGLVSNFADIHRFLEFLTSFKDQVLLRP